MDGGQMMGYCVIVGGADINNYGFIRENLSAKLSKTQFTKCECTEKKADHID